MEHGQCQVYGTCFFSLLFRQNLPELILYNSYDYEFYVQKIVHHLLGQE